MAWRLLTHRSYGDSVYVIRNGAVLVYLELPPVQAASGQPTGPAQQQILATLCAGDFFGEGALLKGKSARRSASISAIQYSLIYSLHVDEMSAALAHHPKVRANSRRHPQHRKKKPPTLHCSQVRADIAKIAAEREDANNTMSQRGELSGSNSGSPNATRASRCSFGITDEASSSEKPMDDRGRKKNGAADSMLFA